MTRKRRSPELARQELLDAAERVFAASQPDQVGLKEIANEAGVSHALITHYFGTYGGLIEAALDRRLRSLREAILGKIRDGAVAGRSQELLETLFDALANPVHLRLVRWMLASERPNAAHAFALRDHGLQLMAHQVAAALDVKPTTDAISKIELALLAAVSAAYGYAIGKPAFAGALGRDAGPELDAELRSTLAAMIEGHLRAVLLR